MKLRPPVVDYRKLRPSNLNSPEFRHLWLLLYWIGYLISFIFIERLTPAAYHYPVHMWLDDVIPFCEWFLIPYVSWIVSLLWMSLYTLAYEIEEFRYFMYYLILTTAIIVGIYIVWPNEQLLRPDLSTLGRSNLLTWGASIIYGVDTNTNVCPSLHCTGAFAIAFAATSCPRFHTRKWKIFFAVFAVLVCASTVFMKQHSIVDFFAALPLIILGYFLFYFPRRKAIAAKAQAEREKEQASAQAA